MRPTFWPRDPIRPVTFALISVLVGAVAGLGAVVFRGLIALFHNLLFLGNLSVAYDAKEIEEIGDAHEIMRFFAFPFVLWSFS